MSTYFVLTPTRFGHFEVHCFGFASSQKHDICCFCATRTWKIKVPRPLAIRLLKALVVGFLKMDLPDPNEFRPCLGMGAFFGENWSCSRGQAMTQNLPPLAIKPSADVNYYVKAFYRENYACWAFTARYNSP